MRGEMSRHTLKYIFKHTVTEEGVRGLYKGYKPAMLGIIIYKGFGFSSYEWIYKMFSHIHIPDSQLNFFAGATAGLFAQFS